MVGDSLGAEAAWRWKLPPEERPQGCTCGYPTFENSSTIRFHTYDCALRTGFNLGHALDALATEVNRARSKFQDFNSPHEGYAVIAEELDELWQHVKENTGRGDEARTEAIQIAAMALRYALDLTTDERASLNASATERSL